ncbi:hypothetical protein GF420_01685 [candidate division GN15 bacterium]|nr:hypothetical protein [candidate division GN15 bacterium]
MARYLYLTKERQLGIYGAAEAIAATLYRDRSQLEAQQLEAVRQIVDFAYANSPFYRERFDAVGYHPGDITKLTDIKSLPVVRKEDLAAAGKEVFTNRAGERGAVRATTGGTTGLSLRFCRDRACNERRRGIDLALNRYYGWRDGEWQGWLWGAPQDAVQPSGLKARLVRNLATRTFFMDTARLDTASYQDFIDESLRRQPTLIGAYPSLAYDLAQRISEGELPPFQVPVVVVSAESLYEFQRESIEATFADHCFSRYGAREIGTAAFECVRKDGCHIFTDSVYIESEPIDDTDTGIGRLLITDLYNRAFPLIRYDIGDLGRIDPSPCPCGLNLPRLVDIRGRVTELFVRADGSLLPGTEIVTAVGQSGLQARVQVVQEAAEAVTVNLEGDPSDHTEELQRLRRLLQIRLGEAISVSVRSVEKISRTGSGKFPYVVSRVHRARQAPDIAGEGPQ